MSEDNSIEILEGQTLVSIGGETFVADDEMIPLLRELNFNGHQNNSTLHWPWKRYGIPFY